MITLTACYQYFDSLFEQDVDDNTLFASSYIRGLFSLVCANHQDESLPINETLLTEVTAAIVKAKSELSPQDAAIVHNFWLSFQEHCRQQ